MIFYSFIVRDAVLRDLTNVLLDPKLIIQLMNPHPCQGVLTAQQCRILLTDIACCSLMRLDMTSMDKLWDLMVMLFKWQLQMIHSEPNRLLELTFRHMDGIGKLMPEMKKTMLIDGAKRSLIEIWDSCVEPEKAETIAKLDHWMKPFSVKISILIRLGFQRHDGTFESTASQMHVDMYQHYVDNIGENVYAKSNETIKTKGRDGHQPHRTATGANRLDVQNCSVDMSHELSTLTAQLNINRDVEMDTQERPASARKVEESNEGAVEPSESVLLVDDVNYSISADVPRTTESTSASEFVHLQKTQTALQGYLEQFQLESKQGSIDSDAGPPFDATAELLKMLDNDEEPHAD